MNRKTQLLILALPVMACAFTLGCSHKKKALALQDQNRSLGQQVLNLQKENEQLGLRLSSAIEGQRQAEQGLIDERSRTLAGTRRSNLGGRFGSQYGADLSALAQRYPSLQYESATDSLRVQEELLFDSGRAHLRPTTESVLADVAEIVKQHGDELRVVVVGHTDDRNITKKPGSDIWGNNFHLSTARANAVSDFFQAAGVPAGQITVQGQGEHQPVASNESPDERRWNRRVEVYLVKRDTPVVGWLPNNGSLR